VNSALHLLYTKVIHIENGLKDSGSPYMRTIETKWDVNHTVHRIHLSLSLSRYLKKQLDSSVLSTQIISSHAKQRAIIFSQCAKGLF